MRLTKKDISLALLLQLILPQVIFLQLMLDDVHAQHADLIVRDEPVELRETAGRARVVKVCPPLTSNGTFSQTLMHAIQYEN